MWKEKPPGLKILWVWTLGTAAVLVANVVRTRTRDMDNLVTQEHSTAAADADADADPDTLLVVDQLTPEDKSNPSR